MSEDGDPASIHSLPDPLLGKIFVAAGLETGPTITVVSKRWRRAFYCEPALWRSIALTAAATLSAAEAAGQAQQWFDAQASMMRRIGRFVQQMHVDELVQAGDPPELVGAQQLAAQSGSGWQLGGSLLAHLDPSTLRSLYMVVAALDEAALAALQRLSGLSRLALHCLEDPPSGLPAALPSLAQLQAFTLTGGSLPPGLLEAVQQLEHLTAFSCSSSAPLPELSSLFPLTQLRQLSWEEEQRPAALQVDVQQLLAHLPHLGSWAVGSSGDDLWQGNMRVADATLGRCRGEQFKPEHGVAAHAVELAGIRHLPSLQRLLAAALPAGTPASSLASLSIFHSRLSQPAVQSCSWLGRLTSLTLSVCSFRAGTAAQVAEALLQQAPRLQSLTLLGCFCEDPLPPALLSRTGLLHLSLQGNELTELAPGPYLSSLESLNLTFNCFTRLPRALAAATSLTQLSLEDNAELALANADADALLRLPRLRRLHLGVTLTPPRVLGRLFRQAPDLEID